MTIDRMPRHLIRSEILAATDPLGEELTEEALRTQVWPLFSRVLNRPTHPRLGRPEIYLANHSLGRPLDCTANDVMGALDLWYRDLDAAWASWMAARDKFRALVAALLGVDRADCVVPKTSAGQGLRAVLNALLKPDRPLSIVATRGEFDSIDFVLKMYQDKGWAKVHWVEAVQDRGDIPLFGAGAIIDTVQRVRPDLLVVSGAFFSTGQVLDGALWGIAQHAKDAGALVLADLYHTVGIVPPCLGRANSWVDFAIGGSYKYTRGGPGACWLYINPRHLDHENEPGALRTLDTGWFAKQDTFKYERTDKPLLAPGGDAWLESTFPFSTCYQALAGMELMLAIGVGRLRGYSIAQHILMRDTFKAAGVAMFMPDPPAMFGAFSLLPHNHAMALSDALRAEGVNTDARGNCVRFGPDILNSRKEIDLAARITARVMQSM